MQQQIVEEEKVKKELQEFISNSNFSWLIENVEKIENQRLSNFKERKVYPMNIPYDIRKKLEKSGSWENFVKKQVLDSAKRGILQDLKKEIFEELCEEKNYASDTIHRLTEKNQEETILNLILEELTKRNRKELFLIVDLNFWNSTEIKSFHNKEIFEAINKIQILLGKDGIEERHLKNNFLFIFIRKKQTPIVPYYTLAIKDEQDASSLNTYFFFHVWYGEKLSKPLNAFAFIKKESN